MPDSTFRNAERLVQPMFRKSSIFSGLVLAALIMLGQWWLRHHRPPLDLSVAAATVEWIPAPIASIEDSRLRLAGAWALKTSDPRIGGISGLAIDGDRLLVLTDGGMIARLPLPPAAGTATLRPLPAVSGNPRTKIGRDSEAVMRDPRGHWWVAFEQRHQLIRYDSGFSRALERIAIPATDFRPNRGVEALSAKGGLSWYAESTGVSDAATLPDGREILLRRRPSFAGFAASLAGPWEGEIAVPLGPLGNAEGLAIQPLGDGASRLWIATDNDFRRWRPTMLVAIDLPKQDAP
jgi:hypothetical protein